MDLTVLYSLIEYPYNVYIAIYILVHILTYIIAIPWQSAPILKSDPKLNAKYYPFARNDYHNWSLLNMTPCKLPILIT
jgi:hypothetical protein